MSFEEVFRTGAVASRYDPDQVYLSSKKGPSGKYMISLVLGAAVKGNLGVERDDKARVFFGAGADQGTLRVEPATEGRIFVRKAGAEAVRINIGRIPGPVAEASYKLEGLRHEVLDVPSTGFKRLTLTLPKDFYKQAARRAA